jgi:hypothetical protein
MADSLWITFDWRAADQGAPDPEQAFVTEVLFREMNGWDGVERVERVANPAASSTTPESRWMESLVQAAVTLDQAMAVVRSVQERVPGRMMTFTLRRGSTTLLAQNVPHHQVEEMVGPLVMALQALPADGAG